MCWYPFASCTPRGRLPPLKLFMMNVSDTVGTRSFIIQLQLVYVWWGDSSGVQYAILRQNQEKII
jgi:hypothetical protein